MKLNVGSSTTTGQYRNKDLWVNIDKAPFDTKNFEIGDPLAGLKYPNDMFDEIHCIHVLEHVEYKDHIPFLTELYRVCQPGGIILVEVPNLIANCEQLLHVYKERKDNKIDKAVADEVIRCMTLSIFGKGRWEGDAHRWGFYPEKLINLVRSIGFNNVVQPTEMISSHYKQEPIILVRGTK